MWQKKCLQLTTIKWFRYRCDKMIETSAVTKVILIEYDSAWINSSLRVKQECPLSPILFAIFIRERSYRLEKFGKNYKFIGEEKMSGVVLCR